MRKRSQKYNLISLHDTASSIMISSKQIHSFKLPRLQKQTEQREANVLHDPHLCYQYHFETTCPLTTQTVIGFGMKMGYIKVIEGIWLGYEYSFFLPAFHFELDISSLRTGIRQVQNNTIFLATYLPPLEFCCRVSWLTLGGQVSLISMTWLHRTARPQSTPKTVIFWIFGRERFRISSLNLAGFWCK